MFNIYTTISIVSARTFADEDVALDVDNVVFRKTVHGDLGFGVSFVRVVNEDRGDLLFRAPKSQIYFFKRFFFIQEKDPSCFLTESYRNANLAARGIVMCYKGQRALTSFFISC